MWLGFVEVEMLLSIEKRLTHVYLISFIGAGRVKLESDISLILRFGVVGGEVVIRLKSLIMGIRLLDVWSRYLKVEVYKTLQSLVHMVNCEQYFWCLIVRA